MASHSFHIWWVVSFVILVVLAGWIGKKVRPEEGFFGMLIDTRGRYSLTHFQLVLWTIVILSSVLGVLVARGFDLAGFVIPVQLLGLMGISAGSGVLAAGVKAGKDADPQKVEIARKGTFIKVNNQDQEVKPHFAQIWLEEQGEMREKVINITKYQNFIFTLVIACVYVTMAWKTMTMPTLPESVVYLIGISHAGYVGGKLPNPK